MPSWPNDRYGDVPRNAGVSRSRIFVGHGDAAGFLCGFEQYSGKFPGDGEDEPVVWATGSAVEQPQFIVPARRSFAVAGDGTRVDIAKPSVRTKCGLAGGSKPVSRLVRHIPARHDSQRHDFQRIPVSIRAARSALWI